jgi:hypothetical protein
MFFGWLHGDLLVVGHWLVVGWLVGGWLNNWSVGCWLVGDWLVVVSWCLDG